MRKKFIKDFYAKWNAANPTKHIYNIDLKDFISVRFLSIQEISLLAARVVGARLCLAPFIMTG